MLREHEAESYADAKRRPPTYPRAPENSCLATTRQLAWFGIVAPVRPWRMTTRPVAEGGNAAQAACGARRGRSNPRCGQPRRADYGAREHQ
jgi:hypothetical protein